MQSLNCDSEMRKYAGLCVHLRRHGHKPAARPLPFLPGGCLHSLLRSWGELRAPFAKRAPVAVAKPLDCRSLLRAAGSGRGA